VAALTQKYSQLFYFISKTIEKIETNKKLILEILFYKILEKNMEGGITVTP